MQPGMFIAIRTLIHSHILHRRLYAKDEDASANALNSHIMPPADHVRRKVRVCGTVQLEVQSNLMHAVMSFNGRNKTFGH